MKKLISALLVLVMILALAVPAMAAGTVSLTVNHIATGHTFNAYQIFDGKLEGAVLSDITWGPGVNGPALLAELKADDTVIWNSDKTQSAVFSNVFASATTAEDVVKILAGFTTDGERLEHFAKLARKHVTTPQGVSIDNGDKTYTFAALDPGYYLIDDVTAAGNVGAQDYKTHYILSLTTHTELTTKGDYPDVDKTVSETLDGTYSEYIARQLNLTYYFKWDVNIDDRISEYTTYTLGFDDVMSKGMTFGAWEEIYFLQADNSKVYLYKDGAWTSDTVKPQVNTQVTGTAGTRLNGGSYTAEETYIRLEWNDLKTVFPTIAGDDHLIVKYSATLNEDAVYGTAMPNDVFIKYSNGPDSEDYGYSVPDYAFVFSFGLRVAKVDADNNEVLLPGAEFKLYHKHGTENHYAVVNAEGEITSWVTDAALASTLVTDSEGKILVYGLDEDIAYFLHETKAPTGYNTMFTDVEFIIEPEYGTDSSGNPVVTAIKYNVDGHTHTLSEGEDFTAGRVVVTVLNDKGNSLPSTGGIGTTLFYIFGSLMFAGAAVLLVTKKRMAA